MPARTLVVDGYDLSLIGFIGESFPSAFDTGVRNYKEQQAHGRIGRVIVTAEPDVNVKNFIVSGHLLGDTRALADAQLHELKYRLYKDTVNIRFANDETIEHRARCTVVQATALTPQITQRAYNVSLRFLLTDPRTYAIADSVVGFTTATAMPMGTARTEPVIRLTGGTDPVLIYKDSSAVEVARMELTWSGTWIDIDMDRKTIIDNAAANQIAALTTGEFFALDPYDGDYPTLAWPTLEVSSSTGQATYRKAYW